MVKIHIEPTPPKRLEQYGQLLSDLSNFPLDTQYLTKHIADVWTRTNKYNIVEFLQHEPKTKKFMI